MRRNPFRRPRDRGNEAEARACHHLQQQGLQLMEQNYQTRRGEIDLIMLEGDCLIFVEVRYRGNSIFGSAAESITPRKQARIIAAASHYLQQQPHDRPCRFDVIAISGGPAPRIEWIRNAFQGA